MTRLRKKKLREKEMDYLLKELGFFLVFISLLFIVSAGNRDKNSYLLRSTIDKCLVHGKCWGISLNKVMLIET